MALHKKISYFTFILLQLCFFQRLFAQMPGMNAVRQNIDMQIINRQMTNTMMMMVLHGQPIPNREKSYQVVLKDSSVKTIKSKIYTDTILHKNYLVMVDKTVPKSDTAHRKQKIYPSQTVSIVLANGHGLGKAAQRDSCWMFRIVTGAIKVYSYLSEEIGNPDFSASAIVALQLDNGPIVSFNGDNLKKMISSDPLTLKPFVQSNYYKAIKIYNADREKKKDK